MRLLQRYITLELIRVFVMVLIGISVLLVFVGVFQQASENGLGPVEVLQILPYVLYSLLPITIPATMLLTVTVVYGRMAGDQELTAARAAGINLLSLIWPSLLLGGCLSVGALLLTDQVIPWSIQKIQETVLLKMEKIFIDKLRSDHQYIDGNNRIAITVIDVDEKTLIKPTIRYTTESGQTYTFQGETANIRFDLAERTARFHVKNGNFHVDNEHGVWISEEEFPFPLPMIDKQPQARHMSVEEIERELDEIAFRNDVQQSRQLISRSIHLMTGRFEQLALPRFLQRLDSEREIERRTHRLDTEYHSRFALAASCFFFVLVGSPFSIMQAKQQFLTSFFMVFMPIILLYYPLIMLAMNQAKNGVVAPEYVVWIANGIIGAVGIWLLSKLMRN